MNKQDSPIRQPGFYVEQSGNETLLLHQEKNVSLYLNGSASLIWHLCDGKRTIHDIEQLLVHEYPESSGDIHKEVQTTVEQLVEHNALLIA